MSKKTVNADRAQYILGDPGAVSRVAGIFVGESRTWAKVYCKNETNPWAITLTEPVPESFEIPAFDWAEKYQRRGPAGRL